MASSKVLPGIAFVLLLTLLGLVTGALVGGSFFVRPGDGLAGSATVLMWGVLGGLVMLVSAILLAVKMQRDQLMRGLLVALVGVMLAALLVWQRRRKAERARMEQRVEIVQHGRLHVAPAEHEVPQSARKRSSSAQPRAA